MKLSAVFLQLFYFFLTPASILTISLYLYPVFTGCGFPPVTAAPKDVCILDAGAKSDFKLWISEQKAPFRLLALADPQLEGDSSLPKPEDYKFPGLYALWQRFSDSPSRKTVDDIKIAFEDLTYDLRLWVWSYRKRLDLLGNDFYLAHIYRTLHWWLAPTHVAVLGDLVGSQWVNDEEFEGRGRRYWNRVFRGGRKVEEHLMQGDHVEILGQDKLWRNRLINIAGNHDIGYAGDIDQHTIDRFEKTYGKVNWEVTFRLPETEFSANLSSAPELRLVVLNSMNLDSPGRDPRLQHATYSFLNEQVIAKSKPVEDRTAASVLLTHIPLRKEAGICVDAPLFNFASNGISEQNTLSSSSSAGILEGMFGMSSDPDAAANGRGRNGIIMNGHDHAGCDVYHYISANSTRDGSEWQATRWTSPARLPPSATGIREVTVQSMMGDFDGNAGLLSGWFDEELGEWRFEYGFCKLGVQHLWWGVHGLDLFVLSLGLGAVIIPLLEKRHEARAPPIQPATTTRTVASRKLSISRSAHGETVVADITETRRSR